ncbi:MAG: hypothetical protein HZT40_09260 [Candidatus Thiothrix singaporensis]|uniref:Carrier domain-containing protein n=1 Tax=Candidatus Thiothrix singaporensis TaxID=2799669 RepID=A0A7L6AYQ6_9GAMM|nr:MAG: hypothetical protein HZT40_09260 [Candidatus Thiothrix singaporensis]
MTGFPAGHSPSYQHRKQTPRRIHRPRTPTETAIARIWQELLRVEQIGVHDRFTDLGGHSLLAIRLLAALQQELGLEVSPGSLREFPSIAEMAANAS